MVVKYAQHISTVPQSEPLDSRQVQNSAGGYTYQVDDWKRLERFLILGCEGGTYYASERKITRENAAAVERCLAADAKRALSVIADVSDAGRAPKNDPAIFALMLAACADVDGDALQQAFDKTVRIGTHLFQFVASARAMRGWGRRLKRLVRSWYERQEAKDLAFQVGKYQSREKWSHRDLLRVVHLKESDPAKRAVLAWAANKLGDDQRVDLPSFLVAFDAVNKATDEKAVAEIAQGARLPFECIPSQWHKSPLVWKAMLPTLGYTAIMRSLGRMTAIGFLAPMSDAVKDVADRLRNQEAMRKARVHPLAVLVASRQYGAGRGDKGSLTWTPCEPIVDALDEAFTLSFGAVEPMGKRTLIGVDVSGSMGWGTVCGSPVTPREASAALALQIARTEPAYHVKGFSHQLVDLPITKRSSLASVVKAMDAVPYGATDCALPMQYALQQNIPADLFVVITDNETWCGHEHPKTALRNYRKKMQIPAKLVVLAMTATSFSIADPQDAGMLDIAGMDLSVPALMRDFAIS